MKNASTYIPALFFLFYLVVGIVVHKDYGISWDEPWQHDNAEVSAQFINEWFPFTSEKISDNQLRNYWNRHHGVMFTLPAYFLERALGYDIDTDFRKVFLLRHQLVFFIFWLTCLLFFFIAKKRFGTWKWALLLTSFLVLSPRLFAHAFFNPKDIVFLFLYLLALFLLLRFLEKRTIGAVILLALGCAWATGMRVGGFVLTLLVFCFVFVDLINHRFERELLRKYSKCLLVFIPAVFCFTIAFWPYLWLQPLVAFQKAFQTMSDYTWDGAILMMGDLVPSKHLPWYYVPVWMVVTIPVLYSLLFLGGITNILIRLAPLLPKGKWYNTPIMRHDVVVLILFAVPIFAVIYKASVLYDGWRHLYFVYPCFLLIGGIFLQSFYHYLKTKLVPRSANVALKVLFVIIGLNLINTLYFIVKNHPHQNVYFAEFMQGRSQLMQYELDYWGLVYKQGFERLSERITDYPVKVAVYNQPGSYNYKFLKPGIKFMFEIVEEAEDADYFISNFRNWHDGLEKYKNREYPYNGLEVDSIMVGKTKILGIYKVN